MAEAERTEAWRNCLGKGARRADRRNQIDGIQMGHENSMERIWAIFKEMDSFKEGGMPGAGIPGTGRRERLAMS